MITWLFSPRHLTAPAAILAFLVPGVPALHAQETRPTFRASVALVPITAVVRDTRHRVVRELQRDDFEVFEDNRPRRVVDFSATDRAPISLAVLFDTSGSMRGPNLETGKIVVNRLLDQLDRASDEAALFTFDKELKQNTPFTREPEIIRQALNDTAGWGATSLYDAIAETAKHSGQRRAQRRAVIVVTDGIDNSSALTPSDVSALASDINVPVYLVSVVAPRHSGDGTATSTSDDGLSNLAYWTGGDLRHVTATEQAVQAAAALVAELRQQYFLAIESAPSSGWYRLDVRTKRKGLTVRARSGYFASAPAWPRSGG